MLRILQGDAIERLRELPSDSVHCCVTSPPYWGLRDYGTAEWDGGEANCNHLKPFDAVSHATSGLKLAKNHAEAMSNVGHKHEPYRDDCGKCGAKRIDSQLGLEKTPDEYVAKMVEIFREVRRVLRKDGTLWLNLGDSYSNAGTRQGNIDGAIRDEGQQDAHRSFYRGNVDGLKSKDLVGIPWRLAFALQADGWYLRSDIIWSKPNPMPESVTDRPTKAHEYLFLLTKSARYFYDAEAIKEQGSGRIPGNVVPQKGAGIEGFEIRGGLLAAQQLPQNDRNKRSVWTVATAPYPEAHFATYPPDLVKPCVLAGTSSRGCCAKCGAPWERIVESVPSVSKNCPKTIESHYARGGTGLPCGTVGQSGSGRIDGYSKTLGWQPTCECEQPIPIDWQPNINQLINNGPCEIEPCTVLDPFAGSGTTGAVALELGRKAILIELNPKYIELIETRCNVTLGLALA
jgi:DNA modification methylase